MRLVDLILGPVQVMLSLVVLVLFAITLNWSSINVLRARYDLHHYANEVRRADRPLADKERLLDRIEALDDLLGNGAEIGTCRWATCDEAIRTMLKDGIQADDVRLIERELQRVEQEIRNTRE